jgi:hypothetical protein
MGANVEGDQTLQLVDPVAELRGADARIGHANPRHQASDVGAMEDALNMMPFGAKFTVESGVLVDQRARSSGETASGRHGFDQVRSPVIAPGRVVDRTEGKVGIELALEELLMASVLDECGPHRFAKLGA